MNGGVGAPQRVVDVARLRAGVVPAADVARAVARGEGAHLVASPSSSSQTRTRAPRSRAAAATVGSTMSTGSL